MATGDLADIAGRFQARAPRSWFRRDAPVFSALAQGAGAVLAPVYATIQAVKAQQRVSTAAGLFLDMIAEEFFGPGGWPRLGGESDDAYRARITWALTAPRGTRDGMASMLRYLTGNEPLILEPTQPQDAGGYNGPAGYGATPTWGSLNYPRQFFVRVFRRAAQFATAPSAWNAAGGPYVGGYNGPSGYGSLATLPGSLTDADIYALVEKWKPVGSIAWVNISS